MEALAGLSHTGEGNPQRIGIVRCEAAEREGGAAYVEGTSVAEADALGAGFGVDHTGAGDGEVRAVSPEEADGFVVHDDAHDLMAEPDDITRQAAGTEANPKPPGLPFHHPGQAPGDHCDAPEDAECAQHGKTLLA